MDRSPFVGIVASWVETNHVERQDEKGPNSTTFDGFQKDTGKGGLGIIAGHNFQVIKRLGLDLHLGCMAELGTVRKVTRLSSTSLPKISDKKHDFNLRPFWGVNAYIALGKMPPKKSKG